MTRAPLPGIGALATALALVGLAVHDVALPWQPWLVAGAFARYLMAAAPVALVALALARYPRGVVFAAALTVVVASTQLPLYLGSAATGGPAVTVLQANLRVGSADPRAVVRLVREHSVDVLFTEELTVSERDALVAAGLRDSLPAVFDRPLPSGGGGLAIWSRYPLSDTRDVPGFELGLLTARVALPGGPATVVAVHVVPPYPYPPRRFVAETARLRTVLAGLAGPVVVGGDFNATPDSADFRALVAGRYADAAAQVGAGYLASYPADRWFPPLIAIDHVLVAGGAAAAVRRVDLSGSDHRGLLARLVLRAD